MVVTRIVQVETAGEIVTRIVPQVIEVTATPPPAGILPLPPVTFDVGIVGQTPSLDPQLALSSNSLDLVENLFAGLTNYNPQTNQIEPELAESWTATNNNQVWRFRLRQDFYWLQVGETDEGDLAIPQVVRPVVANDIVYAVQRACNPATTIPNTFLLFIIDGCERINRMTVASEADLATIGIRALSEYELEISLLKPNNHFLVVTSLPLMYPLPGDMLTEFGTSVFQDADEIPTNLLTSGPFILDSRSIKDQQLILQRNPVWPLPFAGNIEQVNYFHFDEIEDAIALWDDNFLDLVPSSPAAVADLRERNPQKLLLKSKQELFYLGFNFNSGVFRIPEMRRAFSAAIDRERLLEDIYANAGIPMRHFTPPQVVGAPPLEIVGVGYSPSYAQQQMAASGFGDCRLMPPIRYMITASDIALQQAELIQEMLKDTLNCTEDQIIIEQVRFGILLANTRIDAGARRPDMWDLGWESQYPDPHNWLSDVLHCEDSENRPNRPCGQADELIRRANDTVPFDERANIYRQVETLFFGEDGIYPVAPLFVRGEYWLRQVWLSYPATSFGGEHFDMYVIDTNLKAFERDRSLP
ncbi:MAG TPA: peptide ABC transporter substrate-binding protein [Anaerolineae bacterium]|nr:peptide ABC transporter substrate-binding protein [Anaerolineae bacterium]